MDSFDMLRISINESVRRPRKIREAPQYRVDLFLTGSAHLTDALRQLHNLLRTRNNEFANPVCHNAEESTGILQVI